MSAQQTVNTPWYGFTRVLTAAEVRTNFDIGVKQYPMDVPITGAQTWVWPLSDAPLINTKMYDLVLPTTVL
jgi:hypothetical protein